MPLGINKVALFAAAADTGTAVLLSTAIASSSASLSFTLPTAYKQVTFGFYGILPVTDQTSFQFNASIDGGSNYNVTKTTTVFAAYHQENDAASGLGYETTWDNAQSTGYQTLANAVTNDSDQCVTGELSLFNPSGTTYVKHFYATTVSVYDAAISQHNDRIAGYFNDGSNDLTNIQFKMSSGNISSGTIKMWGIK